MNSQRVGNWLMLILVLGLVGGIFFAFKKPPVPPAEPPFVLISIESGKVTMQEFDNVMSCSYAKGFINGVRENAIQECVPK